MLAGIAAFVAAAAIPAVSAAAATFMVNTSDDVDTGACNAIHCSLRSAINAANAAAGSDTIAFDIPGPSPHTIQPLSPLPPVTDPVTIDGTTQPGYMGSPIVELDGTTAGGDGLTIRSGSSTVRALVINRFFPFAGIQVQFHGGNVIEGNFIGTDVTGTVALPNRVGVQIDNGPGDTIGGTTTAARNLISGNLIGVFILDVSPGNVIEGNFIGTDVTGTAALGNRTGIDIDAGASNNTVGGTAAGARNLISGNSDNGVSILESEPTSPTTGNLVEGNFIGTDVTGTEALGNGGVGVSIAATGNTVGGAAAGARNIISANVNGVVVQNLTASGNLIQGNFIGTDATGMKGLGNSLRGVEILGPGNTLGGAAPGAGNVISASGENGVEIAFQATGNLVQGNLIGTNAARTASLGNGASGVVVQQGSNNTIGGTAPGAGNVIAYNSSLFPNSGGILVVEGTGNAILGNSIFSNDGLGIDLFPFGVTPNDPGDADTGSNQLQNFPVLTAASTGGGSTSVSGTLNSMPSTTYRLEFFSNSACDPSGNGEGQAFLGAADVTSDATGNASFTFTFAAALAGQVITATATDPAGNTSEFSNCTPAAQVVVAATVTLSPAFAVNDVGTTHTVTATVTSVSVPPQPQAGVTVRFSVDGSVSVSGACTTDANGQCSFTYQGPQLPGADLITAYPDLDNDGIQDPNELSGSATKAWFLPASTPGQVTGGGQAPNFTGGVIAFGFNAQSTADGVKGNCTVVDRGSGTKIKCLSVTSLVVAGTHATFFGDATINGIATTYRIDVDDLGEPGAGRDTFRIQTESGYVAGGVLTAGNIQIHQ